MTADIPVARAVSLVETDEETKDRLLFSVQIAVKQIQCFCSCDDQADSSLTLDAREIHQLCESLDKTFFHGLRECQRGYWPFVKYFTHKNTVKYIESLKNACTDIQFGRAWLCVALNENMLESYVRSFQTNPTIVRKYYAPVSMLRDPQRAELLIMLMAGLENVPVNLDIDSISWGSGLSFLRSPLINSTYRTPSRCSSELSQCEYPQPAVNHSNNDRDDDVDSGVIDFDCTNDVGVEQTSQSLTDSQVIDHSPTENPVPCNLSDAEIERITKYLNMALESEGASASDLEVIRTKVVRRLKKSPSHRRSDRSSNCEEIQMEEMTVAPAEPLSSVADGRSLKENRLSKATTDSGLSIEDRSTESSDNDTPDSGLQTGKSVVTFDVISFQPQLNVTFSMNYSTPSKQFKCRDFIDDQSPVQLASERGTPEGQEDPVKAASSELDRQPLRPGSDGLEDDGNDVDEEEAEVSIYDLSKTVGLPDTSSELSEVCDDDIGNESPCNDEPDPIVADSKADEFQTKPLPKFKLESEDPVAKEMALLLKEVNEVEAPNIRVDESTMLYLLVEVFEEDKEKFYKMFPGYLDFPKGVDQMALLVLTDRCLYTLKPGNSKQKFILCNSFLYRNVDFIMVNLNSQGFTVVSKSRKQVLSFFTADEDLTGTILSNLEMAFRRFQPKLPVPCVVTDAAGQLHKLRSFLSSEFGCPKDVVVHHFALARWEDYVKRDSPAITPAGPKREGYLMYRHIIRDRHEDTSMAWCPGYFILNGGILYCMEGDNQIEPLFFVQIVSECKGCRRLYLPKRPYAFEVILSSCDVLQLAAPDDLEASLWQEALLHSVALGGHLIDSDGVGPIPSCIIISDVHIVAVKEVPGSVKTLGSADLVDLVGIQRDPSCKNCILMEFGIADASKSCGDWIIVFETDDECQKFLDIICWQISNSIKLDLQITPLKDLSLVKKFRTLCDGIVNSKTQLRELCYEDIADV